MIEQIKGLFGKAVVGDLVGEGKGVLSSSEFVSSFERIANAEKKRVANDTAYRCRGLAVFDIDRYAYLLCRRVVVSAVESLADIGVGAAYPFNAAGSQKSALEGAEPLRSDVIVE